MVRASLDDPASFENRQIIRVTNGPFSMASHDARVRLHARILPDRLLGVQIQAAGGFIQKQKEGSSSCSDGRITATIQRLGPNILALWLSLSEKERKDQFVDTAEAVQRVGVSQRTIRFRIEKGWVQALPIGRKHEVCSRSLMDYLNGGVDAWQGKAGRLRDEDPPKGN